MHTLKEIVKALGALLMGVHVVGAFVSFFVFSYQFAREHGFFTWLFFGEIVPFLKSLVWEFYLIGSLILQSPAGPTLPQLFNHDAPLKWAMSGKADVNLLLNQAAECIRKADFKEALSYCSRAIAAAPEDPNTYVCRGVAKMGLRRHEDAVKDFTAALKLAPKEAMIYAMRAIAYRSQGKLQRALEDCDTAVELDSSNAELYLQRGTVLYMLNRFPDAESDFRQAIELSPKGSAVHMEALTWLRELNRLPLSPNTAK